jgi:prepilin-type N-terminal cleavage/methylation domain-containing protein
LINLDRIPQTDKMPERLRGRSARGFTLIEMIVVAAITLLVAGLAVPLVSNVTSNFKLRGAVSSVTGIIQSTRYQAIFRGCPYQVVFLAAARTYQVQSQCPPAVAFSNACANGAASCPVPLSGSGTQVNLNADVTITFSPGGKVTSAAFPGGGINMVITYANKPPETISVSSYGSINVNP